MAAENPYEPPTAKGGERIEPSAWTGRYAPCYACGQSNAQPVSFTWWGGLLGPKLFTHVKCQACGVAYNGKTGKSNSTAIAIYMAVGFGICLVLLLLIGGFAVFAALS